MDQYLSFIVVNLATFLALNVMIMFYAISMWRKIRQRFLIAFALAAFIELGAKFVSILFPMVVPISAFPMLHYAVMSVAHSVANIVAGFGVYWMVLYFRRDREGARDLSGEGTQGSV